MPCISIVTFWYFLTTSSPAEGKVRSIGGNCSRWRKRASCLITLASVSIARSVWQISQVVSMKLLHVMRRNLIQVHPIWTNLCKSNKNQNMGSLQKLVFSRKNYVFFTGPTIFWVFEAPGICILISTRVLVVHLKLCVKYDQYYILLLLIRNNLCSLSKEV